MSGKQAKRLRRMEEVQESLHDCMKEAVCGLYDQDVRLSNAEHSLEEQDARAGKLESRLDGLTARFDELEANLEFKERLLSVSCDARKREQKRADGYKADFVFWRRLAIGAVCVAGAVAVIAGATRAKGDTMSPDLQSVPVVVQTVDEVQTAPEENENERIEAALLARAHRIENCKVTHYDPCVKCCGKADGITASGLQVTPYVSVVVDPDVIPMGADVLVDYGDGILHYYRADDVGGTVKGNHIDLCVSSHTEALTLGVRAATVYWVEG